MSSVALVFCAAVVFTVQLSSATREKGEELRATLDRNGHRSSKGLVSSHGLRVGLHWKEDESLLEPESFLLTAQETLRDMLKGLEKQGGAGDGALLQQSDSTNKSILTTEDMPKFVDNLFKNAYYGSHNFVDIEDTVGSQKGFAVCTGKKGGESEMTILSLVYDIFPEKYVRMLNANRLKHAETHGLNYCSYSHPLGEHKHVNRVVSKLSAIQALFNLGHKAVVWMDADAVIMNHALDFKAVAKEHSQKDVIWSADFDENRDSAHETSTINSGVFIMKNTPFSSQFLNACRDYQLTVSTDHTTNPDQTAIWDYRHKHDEEFNSHVEILPFNTFNSWSQKYQKGDYVVHMAGGDHIKGKYQTLLDSYMNGGNCCN